MTLDPHVFFADPPPKPPEVSAFKNHWGDDDVAALYRAECHLHEGLDVSVQLVAYRIERYTPCGAWIRLGTDYESKPRLKFVNLRAEKQWASAERDVAIYHLTRRRTAQVRILAHRLECAERELEALQLLKNPKRKNDA